MSGIDPSLSQQTGIQSQSHLTDTKPPETSRTGRFQSEYGDTWKNSSTALKTARVVACVFGIGLLIEGVVALAALKRAWPAPPRNITGQQTQQTQQTQVSKQPRQTSEDLELAKSEPTTKVTAGPLREKGPMGDIARIRAHLSSLENWECDECARDDALMWLDQAERALKSDLPSEFESHKEFVESFLKEGFDSSWDEMAQIKQDRTPVLESTITTDLSPEPKDVTRNEKLSPEPQKTTTSTPFYASFFGSDLFSTRSNPETDCQDITTYIENHEDDFSDELYSKIDDWVGEAEFELERGKTDKAREHLTKAWELLEQGGVSKSDVRSYSKSQKELETQETSSTSEVELSEKSDFEVDDVDIACRQVFNMTEEETIEMIVRKMGWPKEAVDEIEFSFEDGILTLDIERNRIPRHIEEVDVMSVSIHLPTKDKDSGVTKPGHLELDLVELKDSTQGTGTMTKFFMGMNEMIDKTQFDTLTMLANISVGGYAWARLGFVPEPKEFDINKQSSKDLASVVYNLDSVLEHGDELGISKEDLKSLKQLRDEFEKVCKGESENYTIIRRIAALSIPIPMDKLEDVFPYKGGSLKDDAKPDGKTKDDRDTLSLGKALLLGTNWEAKLKLEEDMPYMEAYLKMRVSQKSMMPDIISGASKHTKTYQDLTDKS